MDLVDSCYRIEPKTMVCWCWWIRLASILRMMFQPYLAAGQTLAFSEEKFSNAQLGTWRVCGWTPKKSIRIINWESLKLFFDTVILDFSTLMITVERYDTKRRFVMMTNGLDIATSKWTRYIWVRQCGVYRLQWGAGRQIDERVRRTTWQETRVCLNCTKYFLVKWWISCFDWMDAN